MAITYFSEHVTTGLSRLLAQFHDKPNMAAVVTAILQQIQDIEDAADQLLNDFTIDALDGDNLDLIGRIVGQDRMGLVDADYRLWLKARIQINRSSGTAEEIINVLKLITGFTAESTFELVEDSYPASFALNVYEPLGSLDPQVIYDIIDLMRGATIDFTLTYGTTAPLALFDDAGTGFDTGTFSATI